mmetsp:Transcript_18697/g.26490  ORF Transcript_18697/g.26490 Transcript_18697/m.26490 type:complete len:446 (-) Transcript_18697:730-2067(-)|eukprot:CAMPEP_0172422326 /NCGR_PEP_ID=MMETSP1064-20121228/8485_1 /TAXON_ID=202472 /ORGANISM="Aulacoseira subarctica , Strain CCAP 1002/5" /LENGTH=445 /DNA_ID=CAMNT_0013163137 /DNA_START=159 /DNA_END=1496 /DNA_ORIENTATION=-
MKRDNSYAKSSGDDKGIVSKEEDDTTTEGLLVVPTNLTKKRAPSPVPLFANPIPQTWTHHTRQVSDESTNSAGGGGGASTRARAAAEQIIQDEEQDSANWWVDVQTPQVPLYYPLASSSCFVENEVASTVSSRISQCLVQRSIAAVYNGAVADATTLDGTSFYIRLFRGSSSNTTTPSSVGGIVVELQHRTGSPLTFHKICHIIFEAAKGKPYAGLLDHTKAPPLDKTKTNIQQEQLLLSLEKAYELLEKDRIDANRLGMEMLSLLTSPDQTNAEFVAETIILGRDILGSSIYERIFDLLQHSQQMDDDDDDDDRRDEVDILRPLAIQVLRNSLLVLARRTDMREVIQGLLLPEWLVDNLIPVLLQELEHNMETDPNGAFLVVESLSALLDLSDRASDRAEEQDALPILERAQEFGVHYHASLGQASNVAANTLRSYMNCKTEKD